MVVIKDFAMPENCYECPLLRSDYIDGIHGHQCNATLRTAIRDIKGDKFDDCPLVEIKEKENGED